MQSASNGAFSCSKDFGELFFFIPARFTEIEGMSFQFCNDLTSVFLPSSLKKIGKYAFWGCDKLSSILVHDSDVDRIKKLLPHKMRRFVKPLFK